MPFIQLQLPEGTPVAPLASRLAREVAAALDLDADGVIVSAVSGAVVVDGNGPVAGWPAAIIHGRDRGPATTERALAAARAVLTAAGEDAWVTWLSGVTA